MTEPALDELFMVPRSELRLNVSPLNNICLSHFITKIIAKSVMNELRQLFRFYQNNNKKIEIWMCIVYLAKLKHRRCECMFYYAVHFHVEPNFCVEA